VGSLGAHIAEFLSEVVIEIFVAGENTFYLITYLYPILAINISQHQSTSKTGQQPGKRRLSQKQHQEETGETREFAS